MEQGNQSGMLAALNAIAQAIQGEHLLANRQDDTSNATQDPSRLKIQFGYGVKVPGVAASFTDPVTFAIPYTSIPIVIVCGGGDDTGASTALGAGGAERQAFYMSALTVTTTGFTPRGLATANWSAGDTAFYHWIAIGI